MSVRILIADDHGVVRKGLRALLESVKGWRVCAEATSGRDAVAEVKRYKPDVAILDIAMPGLNGVEAARQISKSSPQTRMLILSMHKSEKLVREVIEAGAHGYLLKDDADSDLVAAVDALRRHKPYFSFKVAQMAAREKKERRRCGTASPPDAPSTGDYPASCRRQKQQGSRHNSQYQRQDGRNPPGKYHAQA